MSKVLINAKIYTGERVIDSGYIRFSEVIEDVGEMSAYQAQEADDLLDVEGQLLIPGFIEVHSHGGYGIDTMDADVDKIIEMAEKMMINEGVTSLFATTMTQSDENIERAMIAVSEAIQKCPSIIGVHLEGPFVSPEYKGAQSPQYMAAGNAEKLKRWHKMSGENVKLVTYAPEAGDVSEFEDYAVSENIVLSVGHSGATYEELVDSKATHVTHLYNGQKGLHHREPGVTGYGLLDDDTYVEMIVDGFHIAPEMVKLAYRAKGPEKIILITDSMRAKGMLEGRSELGGQEVFVKDKQARLANGSLAGSVLTFNDAFVNMINFSGCSVEEAVMMSSVNQAREFGLTQKGSLEVGKDADFLLMNPDFDIQKTISGGKIYDRV